MNRKFLKDYAGKMTRETGVRTTVSQAENEVVAIMTRAAKILAPSFRFGYHSNEDMEQMGIVKALMVLDEADAKYDISRPLENFIHTVIHNELYNFKRKHYARLEPPCSCCDPSNPPAYPCQKYIDWKTRNSSKQNIMQPLDMSNVVDEAESSMKSDSCVIDETVGNELRTLIDRELPVELRSDYLQMLDGKVIPKARRERVRDAVLIITKERGYLDASEEESD